MSNTDKRDEWERHNRDEAEARAAQQAAAGSTHKPVPAATYANLGTQAAAGAGRSLPSLIEEYERATIAERVAWLALRTCLESNCADAASWNEWRDAVENTHRAMRGLVQGREQSAP